MNTARQHIFTNLAALRRAATVAAVIERYKAQGQAVPPAILAEGQLNQATLDSAPPDVKAFVVQNFPRLKAEVVSEALRDDAGAEAEAELNHANSVIRDVTKDMAGRPKGLTLEMAAALRAGKRPVLKVNKLPTGEAADALVRRGTRHLTQDGKGLSEKEYRTRLEHLAEVGVTSPRYNALAERYFPGVNRRQLDKLVVNAVNDSVSIELRRRHEATLPDTHTMRGLHADEERRIDLLMAIGEEEPDFGNQTRDDNVRRIAEEEKDSTRGAVAQAILDAGGLDAIDIGPIREDASEEIVGFEESNDE